jgi:hypothetical protein
MQFGKKGLLSAVATAALTVFGASAAMADVKPMTIRIAADLTGPPHPASRKSLKLRFQAVKFVCTLLERFTAFQKRWKQ